ncbi:hypothetical protein J421_5305 (plasmid) [Gemmatirosa kalamazoonensis]|uniref:Uncharacterized protein n=1 Tax=Gemmatirosa kalamazoonensis TaxID=861299 RepID=W0RR98_9BACT|nr:hypothetical protein J421_5305 [Gemmatirosa kalamazoonensis]
MGDHADYRYSITIQSDDPALVNCLRSLSQFSQKTGNNRICWGGTKDKDWERDGHRVTFRFSKPAYREGFLAEINRLLPNNLWRESARSDADPARPQA